MHLLSIILSIIHLVSGIFLKVLKTLILNNRLLLLLDTKLSNSACSNPCLLMIFIAALGKDVLFLLVGRNKW